MALTLLPKDELAARGALSYLGELKAQIAELYKTYPKLLKIEQEDKRRATMMKKYGTLNPTKAQMAAKADQAASVAGVPAPKAKVSHKKGQGKKAAQAAQANAAVDAATGSAIGSQTGPQAVPASSVAPSVSGPTESESIEVTEGEPVGAQG
jgi:hypothetical protein